MRAKLSCAWCGKRLNPRRVYTSGKLTMCRRPSVTLEPECADYLLLDTIPDADRNPPRPITVDVPCE